MGRRRKYFSEEERQNANNEKVKQFYWRNKDTLDKKAKAYYWKKKIDSLTEKGLHDEANKVREKALQKGIEKELLVTENYVDKQ